MKKLSIGSIVALLVILLFGSFYLFIYSKPSNSPGTEDLGEFTIGISSLPEGWEIEFGPAKHPPLKKIRGEADAVYLQFSFPDFNANAMHEIYLFRNNVQAMMSYYLGKDYNLTMLS